MAVWLILAGIVLGASQAWAFEVHGLSTPESMIVDPQTGHYYVSNINGSPVEKDNNGFITKLRPDGSIQALAFIQGGRDGVVLHAPKGLALRKETLYVADIDAIRAFDTKTGKLVATIDLSPLGAKFLNALAIDPTGVIYVSDTTIFVDKDALPTVFRIGTENQHRASVFARDRALAWPNGLTIHPTTKRLLVATWGPGTILELGPEGDISIMLAPDTWKDLDGLDYDASNNLYVSSFSEGTIYRITPDLTVSQIASGLGAPADIHVDRGRQQLLVPLFKAHTAKTIALP